MHSVTDFDSDHPRNSRGRWTEKPHDDPGQSVLPGRAGRAPAWKPAASYPYPLANDLAKVAIVADLVRRGADTPDAIAYALHLPPQEGRHYADTAAWMGILERGSSVDGFEVYRISRGAGEQFVELDNDERALVIAMIVDQIPDTGAPRDDVVARMERDGLTPATARRRADTMAAWRTQIDSCSLTWRIGDTEDQLADRFAESFRMAREQRAEARARGEGSA